MSKAVFRHQPRDWGKKNAMKLMLISVYVWALISGSAFGKSTPNLIEIPCVDGVALIRVSNDVSEAGYYAELVVTWTNQRPVLIVYDALGVYEPKYIREDSNSDTYFLGYLILRTAEISFIGVNGCYGELP